MVKLASSAKYECIIFKCSNFECGIFAHYFECTHFECTHFECIFLLNQFWVHHFQKSTKKCTHINASSLNWEITVFEIRYFFVKPIVKIFLKKSVKNRKNQQKCENENTRKTTKLVIIISNREHTLDVISKAFIFWSCWQKWWFRVRHVIEIFRKNEPNFSAKKIPKNFGTLGTLKLWRNWWILNSVKHLIPNKIIHNKIHVRDWLQITQLGLHFDFSALDQSESSSRPANQRVVLVNLP